MRSRHVMRYYVERGYDMRFKGIEKEREMEAKGSNGVRFPDLTISGC